MEKNGLFLHKSQSYYESLNLKKKFLSNIMKLNTPKHKIVKKISPKKSKNKSANKRKFTKNYFYVDNNRNNSQLKKFENGNHYCSSKINKSNGKVRLNTHLSNNSSINNNSKIKNEKNIFYKNINYKSQLNNRKNLSVSPIKNGNETNLRYNILNFNKNLEGSEKNVNKKLHNGNFGLYERDMQRKMKKEEKYETLRKQKLEDELKEVRSFPKINNLSKRMIKDHTPIYKRINEIENKKYKNKEIIIMGDEITEKSFNNKKHFNENHFTRWLLSNQSWILKKNIKLETLRYKINEEKREIEEKFKYKPQIDKNSTKIYNMSKSRYKSNLSYRNINEEIENFTPSINKTYQISKGYYAFMKEDQIEKYYSIKEQIKKEEKKYGKKND